MKIVASFSIACTFAVCCLGNLLPGSLNFPTLSTLATKSLFSLQLAQLPFTEPIIVYEKLSQGKLQILGFQFIEMLNEHEIHFIKYIADYFLIEELLLSYIVFDESFTVLISILTEMFKPTMTKLTFTRCYFPDNFTVPHGIFLPKVTEFQIKDCFASDFVLKEALKMVTKSVTKLSLDNIHEFPDMAMINNEELEYYNFQGSLGLMRFSTADLVPFFPNLSHLELIKFDLNDPFNVSSFLQLRILNLQRCKLETDNEVFRDFPSSLKKILISTYYLQDPFQMMLRHKFIENNIIVDCAGMLGFCNYSVNELGALLTFNSFDFYLDVMSDMEFNSLIDFLHLNRHRFEHVKEININFSATRMGITQLFLLVECFEQLQSLIIYFKPTSTESFTEVLKRNGFQRIKKLVIYFRTNQSLEEYAFEYHNIAEENVVRFLFTLLKSITNLKTLHFFYYSSNAFIGRFTNLLQNSNFDFTSLESYHVTHWGLQEEFFLMEELLLISKMNVKNFYLSTRVQILLKNTDIERLSNLPPLPLQQLDLFLLFMDERNCNGLRLLLSKLPLLTTIRQFNCSYRILAEMPFNTCHKLQKVVIHTMVPDDKYDEFFNLFPLQLQEMHMKWYNYDLKVLRDKFHKRFPNGCIRFFTAYYE